MNKRIKQLMDEAVRFRLDPDSNAYEAQVSPEDLEFFAELIIRECATLVPPEQSHAPNGQPILKIFEEHFGVEE